MIEIDFSKFETNHLNSIDLDVKNCFKKKTDNISEIFFTSGTSGDKKRYEFTQKQIHESVKQTLHFFDLKRGDTLVNPLPLDFVAGKMNIYRAIYGKLNYIQIPAKNIENNIPNKNVDFITVVPNQLYDLLKHIEKKKIDIKQILVGGGEWIDFEILKKLNHTKVYQSFASTETLTHFAIKQIYPDIQQNYTLIKGFSLEDHEGKIFVKHSIICPEGIYIDDFIEIKDNNQFKWIGRESNMIKSGGVKMYPEIIEKKLSNLLQQKYVIVGIPDNKFGEIVVLCIEGKLIKNLNNLMSKVLDRYEVPKKIVEVNQFPLTESGKIKRKELIEYVKRIISK
jgi:O-succinylbenzoic acid--CoA ligase